MRKLVSWDEFVKVLKRLGYSEQKPGQRGGSGMPFLAPDGRTRRSFHKPHNGAVLYPGVVAKRLGITKESLLELIQ